MGGRRFRVTISGSYGSFNIGDEAILSVIISRLKASLPVDVTVVARDAEEARRLHPVVRAVGLGALSRHETEELLRGTDLFILGGGGILYDFDLEMYLREARIAQELGVPVMVYAVSVGPLERRASRESLREFLDRASRITVRDRASAQLLEELGVTRAAEVTADPALLLEPEPLALDDILRAEAIDPSAKLVGLSVRELGPAAPDMDIDHYHGLLANAADFLIDRYGVEVVFVPFERRSLDARHSHGVIARMGRAAGATVLKRAYAPAQILSLLRHFEFFAGMRLHSLIFAALADLPFVALPYGSKVSGLLESLGLESESLENATAGQFIAAVDRAWSARAELRAQVRGALKRLRALALRNNAVAVELLRRGRRGG